MGFFSDFQYGFRSFHSTVGLLTVVSVSLFFKFKSCGVSVWLFGLIFSFLGNRQLWVFHDGKTLQGYPVNVGVFHCSIFGLITFNLSSMVI